MTKAKTFALMIALSLLLGLLGLVGVLRILAPATASAITEEVKWFRVSTPTEGEWGGWVLASGADTQHLTMAADGTLYCYATPSGTSYRLFKSTDEGNTWSETGMVQDAIVDIAIGPDNSVYYATEATPSPHCREIRAVPAAIS